MKASHLIQKLELQPHPEGGYYKETYRSNETIFVDNKKLNLSTAIYYLLENDDKSLLHRIKSDELWFFHYGEPIEIVTIIDGIVNIIQLGNKIENGEVPQVTIPANTWFGARLKTVSTFALVSCTVSPGFEFSDFELAKREDLIKQYPDLQTIIREFTN